MNGDARIKLVTQKIVDRLVAEYAPEKIILYGSYAYGEPDEDSDIDLLIVKKTEDRFVKRIARVCRTVSGLHPHIPFEPIVLTPAELEQRLRIGDQFIDEIVRRGEVL